MPAWVSEGSVRKYFRALETLKKENSEVTEEAIKALYVKWGGLVLEETEEIVEEAPASRRARKAE